MLRNYRPLWRHLQERQFRITNDASKCAKSTAGGRAGTMHNISRQGKIMSKLFGNRIVGSKKRWYPHADTINGNQATNVAFQASQFGKNKGSSDKNATRRVSVLNKLFMTHITDLLATGEASEAILGRGMQVSRIKISADFACVNVYWHGNGAADADAALETELQRCTGVLRHELSQLRLMGEVPRIKFVRDKTGGSLNQVEALLRDIDFDKLDDELADDAQQQYVDYDVAKTVRQEFYGNAATLSSTATSEAGNDAADGNKLPDMRHDVLGLNHSDIMSKILTKMRKSKQAWAEHKQLQDTVTATAATATLNADSDISLTHSFQLKLKEAAESSNKFDSFLAKQRRERKQTPERKKFKRETHEGLIGNDDAKQLDDPLALLSPQQRNRYSENDYLIDDQSHYDSQK